MSDKRPYQIPGFLVHDLNEGQPFAEKDAREIEDILASADHFAYPGASTESNWLALKSRIESPMTAVKKPVRQFSIFKWAAAAVVVMTIGFATWQLSKNSQQNFTASYQTTDNTRLVKLPDGSSIQMNKFTELDVTTMNDEDRVINLKSGEAFFQVTHNNLPFSVQTSKGNVVVTGTEFNVRNREKLPFCVFLKTGKVHFETASKSVDIQPGESLKDIGGEFRISRGEEDMACAWLANKIVFHNRALADIVKELEAVYQVKFVYDQKLEQEKFNLVCDNTLTAKQVAELLTKVVNSKVTIE